MDLYGKIGDFVPDKLIAGNDVALIVKGVVLAAAQGVLTRGTVLGKSPVDSKYYKVSSVAEPVVKRTLQLTGEETKVATLALAGLSAASLKVYVGDENGALAVKGEAEDYTAVYAEGTLTITVVALGALVGVAQCYIEIDKVASGADVADCVLIEATDTGALGTTDDVVAEAYRTGHFNRDALVFGGEDTAATHEDMLRTKGIFLSDNIAY